MPATFGETASQPSYSLTTPGATFSFEPVQGAAQFAVPGPAGPRGNPGSGGGEAAQVFEFDTPSSEWVCDHGLGRPPIVAVYDLSGNLRPLVAMEATDPNTLVLTPTPPLAGKVVIA